MKPQDLIVRHSRSSSELKNNDFLGFSLANVRLNHKRFDTAISAIAKLQYNQQQHGNGGGLLIIGPSGTGKSVTAHSYSEDFPPYREGEKTVTPVMLVTCPSSATANGLISAMYDALGYPIPARTDLAEKTIKICKLIKMHNVEIMLIDEFQHAYYSRSLADFRQLIDTVKNVISTTKIASVLIGLDEIAEVISSNEQLARRYSEKIKMTNFIMNYKDDFNEFRAILKAFQKYLIIQPVMPLYEANVARRFWFSSDGNLDYLKRILEKSVEIAGFAGLERLNEQVYAAAFREYVWKEVPEILNPFHEQSLLRRLNRPGEPFYPWHLKHAIGSPLARRNIIKPAGSE